jgi:DNA topoisomerase-3
VKNLYIAEKPSVAREFAKALGMKGAATAGARDGYLENEDTIVTWCVGHLVTMSYPEVYDPALKKWSFDTIPFIPEEYKYEIIDASSKQFQIVSKLLNREDVGRIYVCTDSGREGEYIYRLVEQMAGVDTGAVFAEFEYTAGGWKLGQHSGTPNEYTSGPDTWTSYGVVPGAGA